MGAASTKLYEARTSLNQVQPAVQPAGMGGVLELVATNRWFLWVWNETVAPTIRWFLWASFTTPQQKRVHQFGKRRSTSSMSVGCSKTVLSHHKRICPLAFSAQKLLKTGCFEGSGFLHGRGKPQVEISIINTP